jgi:hypothetical protein
VTRAEQFSDRAANRTVADFFMTKASRQRAEESISVAGYDRLASPRDRIQLGFGKIEGSD